MLLVTVACLLTYCPMSNQKVSKLEVFAFVSAGRATFCPSMKLPVTRSKVTTSILRKAAMMIISSLLFPLRVLRLPCSIIPLRFCSHFSLPCSPYFFPFLTQLARRSPNVFHIYRLCGVFFAWVSVFISGRLTISMFVTVLVECHGGGC